MPEKVHHRPLSASRTRRQSSRRSSLNSESRPSETLFNPLPTSPDSNDLYSDIDLRPTLEKIKSLENEMKLRTDDSTPEELLNSLVLLQLYTSLEYGAKSIENARAYINLSKFYFDQKNLLPQAKLHILNARQIIEQLNIQPVDDHLMENELGFEIYYLLVKYSIHAKKCSVQRETKSKNKHILSIDTTHIEHDLSLMKEYLEKLKHLVDSKAHNKKYLDYLLIKFDVIVYSLSEFNSKIFNLTKKIIENIDKYPSNSQTKAKIDIFLRSGFYCVHFPDQIQEAFKYCKQAVELAENEDQREPSDLNREQLANALFQWARAKLRADRFNDKTEQKLKRAMALYRTIKSKTICAVIDELATLYIKMDRFQDALDILCDSLDDKKEFFDGFSDEVIQTESRIGAIYLRECDYRRAAEHLKECLDLQEFVYGVKDPRTCQTRDALDLLKKDPQLSRTFFSRTQEGIRQDRPAFRLSNRVSYDKDDQRLLLTVTDKPPISSRN